MRRTLARSILLALVLAACAVAAPAFADPVPTQAPAPQAALAAPPAVQPACAPSLDLFASSAEPSVCKTGSESALPVQPEWMAVKKFHGFCRCSCTFTPDCNTSADCGGSPCLAGITCC